MKLKTLIIITCLTVSLVPIGIIAGLQGINATIPIIMLIAVITISISVLMAYIVSKPIENLTEKINTISKGELNTKIKESEIHEINDLVHSLNRVMASLKLAVHKVGVKKGEIFEDAVREKEILERKHNDFLKSFRGWAWEITKNGEITFCSNNIIKSMKYDPEELRNQNFFKLIHSYKPDNVKSFFIRKGNKKECISNLETWCETDAGEKKWYITNAIPFYDDKGNLAGFRGVNTDVSDEKFAEERIKNLKKDLNSMRKEITCVQSFQAV